MPLRPGDLVGCVSRDWKDWVAGTINVCTFGVPCYSIHHLAIVGQPHDEPLIYEAIGRADGRPPCHRLGIQVSGCQAHTVPDFLEACGEDYGIWHYPLRSELYADEADRLAYHLESKLGTPYDKVGAVRSGGWMFAAANALLHDEDTSAFFCSEYCVDGLVSIGRFQTNYIGKWNPNRTVRHSVRVGIHGRPRLLNPR